MPNIGQSAPVSNPLYFKQELIIRFVRLLYTNLYLTIYFAFMFLLFCCTNDKAARIIYQYCTILLIPYVRFGHWRKFDVDSSNKKI